MFLKDTVQLKSEHLNIMICDQFWMSKHLNILSQSISTHYVFSNYN